MNEFRKKQKRLYRLMKISSIFGAVFLFVYIGIQPYVAQCSQLAATISSYACDIIVIAVLCLLFFYYSKYGKADGFLTSVENEINDAGYYISAREESSIEAYSSVILDDLSECGYSINKNIEIYDFEFYLKAYKGNEHFYIANVNNLDKNDVLAYLESVINDITINSLKRKGNVVLCFVTDNAKEDAISLSKMITPLGKKEKIKIALAICETATGRVYFLGNVQTKCQQMIANFVMNCDIPIKDQYIGKEKLQFQFDIEEKMKNFNITDFKNGNFYVH